MKKIYFLLFMLSAGQLFGQIVNQNIPSVLGATSTLRAPNGTSAHTSIRAHYMIYPADLTALPSGAQIVSAGFVYINGCNTNASGNLKFYMENSTATSNTKSTTWTTAITGMDIVYDGTYNIPVSTTGVTSSFVLSDTFTYAGNGIQIAYDYLGTTFATTAATYDCNNSVSGDLKLVTSSTTTPGAVLTGSSSWRPGIYIGYINPFTNDLAVEFITLNQGHHNKVYDTTQSISGTITNNSIGALTSVPVSLDITGANPSFSTQTIATIAAGSSLIVTFTGLSAANSGIQQIKLSVPSDQFTANDSVIKIQSINCDTISWADNSVPYTAIGFNTGSGILAAKHTGSSMRNTTIKSIYVNIDGNTNITGNQLQAVLLDTGGTIIDSSAIITVTAGQLNTRVNMPLTGNNLITTANPDYYIGIRQYANATVGYFPISSHNPSTVPTGRYFGFGLAGGTPSAPYTTLGALGIGALIEVEPITLSSSIANDSICVGESITFTASGTSSPLYDFKTGGTSVQNSASSTYSTTPTASLSATVEGEYNTCPILSNTKTITLVTIDSSANKLTDSTGTATMSGANYQWIDCVTGLAVPGATSQLFLAPVSGNYQVAVTLNGCSDTSSCYSFIVPVSSINENKIESLKVYPSPTSNLLNVTTDAIQITRISIQDVNGRIVWNSTPLNSASNIDVANLNSGVYLITVHTENGKETRRFIKQ
ncbi:MAG: T9SS type A sorting domain-containing protein [Flavobacteriales bacterium]